MGTISDRNQPAVYLAGKRIAGEWAGGDILALAGLSFTWGRGDIYARNEPTIANLEILDPGGQWGADSNLTGTELVVTRGAFGLRVFRGRVTRVAIRTRKIHSPATNKTARVFIVKIEAACTMATLAGWIPTPPALPNPGYEKNWGARYWRNELPNQRIDSLRSAGLSRAEVDGMGYGDQWGNPPYQMRQIPEGDKVSGLEMLERVYRSRPLTHVNWHADTNQIQPGRPASGGALGLAYIGGVVNITVSGTAHVLPADALEVDDEAEIASTVTEAIDTVQLTVWPLLTSTGEDLTQDRVFSWKSAVRSTHTARYTGSQGERILEIELDATDPSWPTTGAYEALLIPMVNAINGKFTPPNLAVDIDRLEGISPNLENLLLSTRSFAEALFFAGSMFNSLPNSGPMFQLIGATLAWNGTAWRLSDMKLAPSTDSAPDLPLSALSANATATLGEVDDTIRLSDLRYISQGVPA